MIALLLYFLRIAQEICSLHWQDALFINIPGCIYITCHKESIKKVLKSSITSLLVFFSSKACIPPWLFPEKDVSLHCIFLKVCKSIYSLVKSSSTITSGSFVIKIVYVYSQVLNYFLYSPSHSAYGYSILRTPLFDLIIEFIYLSLNVIINSFWFTLRFIVKIQRFIFIII